MGLLMSQQIISYDSVKILLNCYISCLVLNTERESVTSDGNFRADWFGRYS